MRTVARLWRVDTSLSEGRSLTTTRQVQSHCLDFPPQGSLSILGAATVSCANVRDFHPSVAPQFVYNGMELTFEKCIEVTGAVDLDQITESILKRQPQGRRFG